MILVLEITAIEKDSTGLRVGPVSSCASVCRHRQIRIKKYTDMSLGDSEISKWQLRIGVPPITVDCDYLAQLAFSLLDTGRVSEKYAVLLD
jgi:hypothetical protein